MSLLKLGRKPTERKQGLKILFYGKDGCGKSLSALSFPNNIVIDTESKVGVYESKQKYNKNILEIVDINNFTDLIPTLEEVLTIKNPEQFTVILDSETNIFESLRVSCLNLEEKKAIKNAKDKRLDEEYEEYNSAITQRGWGKIKSKFEKLKNTRIRLSANGVNFISIAHLKEVKDKNGIVVDEIPEIRPDSLYDYDIKVKFETEIDALDDNKTKFFIIVEKDTTESFKLNERIEITNNIGYLAEILSKDFGNDKKVIKNNYNSSEEIENKIIDEENIVKEMEDIKIEISNIFKNQKDANKKEEIKNIIKNKTNDKKISEIDDINILKDILSQIKGI